MNTPTPTRRAFAPTGTTRRTHPARGAAVLLSSAALLAIAGFTALGSVFDYPAVLQEPTHEMLAHYREHAVAVSGWFLVLVVSAALLAPAGVLLGRLAPGRLGRLVAGVGIAAATVQVVGLARWVLVVPWLSDAATDPSRRESAEHTVELLHTWLGVVLGETVGYALTATFTVLVVVGLRRGPLARSRSSRWLAWLGVASAALVATGVVIPLGVSLAELTNFVGYVAWCLWLLLLSAALWRTPPTSPTSPAR